MPQTFTLEKFHPSDDYPVCRDTDLEGGYRVVADTTARDAIVTNQRKIGILVFVQADGHYYQLQGGITNLDWVDLGNSLGGISNFIELSDVPPDYIGHGGKIVVVKATEDGLEFIDYIAPNFMPAIAASNAVPYDPSALTTDMYIGCDTSGGTVDVTISAEDIATGSPTNRRIFIVADEAGNASVNRIRVSLKTNVPGLSGLINGADYKDITLNWNSITLSIDGTNGFIY